MRTDYSQARSFNLGIAADTSVEAALLYNDLVYFQGIVGHGVWFYRSYEQLLTRLPVMSESTMRRAIKSLTEGGWLITKVAKVNGSPTLHFQIDRFLSVKLTETKETVKLTETYNDKVIKETTKNPTLFLFGGKELDPAAVLSELLQIVNPREKPTADRLRVLNGRLKDYSADEIAACARVLARSDWHKENGQMSVDNLLAPSKIGKLFAKIKTSDTQPKQAQQVDDDAIAKKLAKNAADLAELEALGGNN